MSVDARTDAPAAVALTGVDGKYRCAALPAHYVARPRLSALLDAVPPGGVGLVIGPSGSGKTTAVRAWLDELSDRSAWLNLDVLDSDPDRFWRSVGGAFERLAPASAGRMARAVEATGTAGAPVLLDVLDDVAAAREPLVLIVDDLHLRAVEPNTTGWVVTQLPPNLRLVVTTRHEPPWALARMRAAGVLAEIRYDDLLFDEIEAASVLDRLLDGPAGDAATRSLIELTEGWIAPLVVAARCVGRGGDDPVDLARCLSSAGSAIVELLDADVLADEDAAIVDLLVETSVLDVLQPEVCAAVGERTDALDLLRTALAHQLVLRVDEPLTWRVPRPLREALRARLRDIPFREQRVHRRAARWFGAEGPPEAAAAHAMASGDARLSRELFVKHGPMLLGRGAPGLALSWGRSLPDEVLDDDPWHRLEVAWIVALAGASGEAAAHIARASNAATQHPEMLSCLRWWTAAGTGDLEEADRIAVDLDGYDGTHPAFRMRWLLRAQALLAAGQLDAAAAVIDDGIRDPMAGRLVPEHARLSVLAELAWLQGDLAGARQHADAALDSWSVTGLPQGRANLPALRAKAGLALEAGDLDAAANALDDVDRLVAHAEPTVLIVVAAVAARSAFLRASDRAEAALELIEWTRRQWDSSAGPRVGASLVAVLAVEEVRVRLDLGDIEGAANACTAASSRPEASLLVARTSVAAGDYDGASRALGEPRPTHPRAEVEALLLGARAASDNEVALQLCADAVRLGIAHGFLRTLTDERSLHGLYATLYRTAPSRAIAAIVGELDGRVGHPNGNDTVVTGSVDHLTHRELDVLRLLPSRLSNQEIAGELDVSLNTAKTHLKSLYRKFGVDTRRAAVDHGRRLGLIR